MRSSCSGSQVGFARLAAAIGRVLFAPTSPARVLSPLRCVPPPSALTAIALLIAGPGAGERSQRPARLIGRTLAAFRAPLRALIEYAAGSSSLRLSRRSRATLPLTLITWRWPCPRARVRLSTSVFCADRDDGERLAELGARLRSGLLRCAVAGAACPSRRVALVSRRVSLIFFILLGEACSFLPATQLSQTPRVHAPGRLRAVRLRRSAPGCQSLAAARLLL